MLATKAVRLLAIAVMGVTIAAHSVMAQEDIADAKSKHTAVHASGPVTIAGTTCASPSAAIECYSISSSALKQGKNSNNATLSGTLTVSTATSKKGKSTVCYTLLGAGMSTETITAGSAVVNLDFGPATVCVTTNAKKETSSEAVTPPGPWTTTKTSPEQGSGKETWKVTPTNAASTTSPLAGSGTVSFTGKVTP